MVRANFLGRLFVLGVLLLLPGMAGGVLGVLLVTQVDGALLKRIKSVIDDGMQLPLDAALKLEIERGTEHNATISADFAEKSRSTVMARGREQKG